MSLKGGRELLISLKATTNATGPVLSLPVGHPLEAVLRPVATRRDHLNFEDVRLLTEWRNRFVGAFLTNFEAHETRTANWLMEMVGPDETRILFMVDDAQGRTVGYMGLAFINWANNSGEADAIVRGADCAPGLMSRALLTMLEWGRVQLGLERLGVRVRSDNPALEFFRKIGFREERRVALRRIDETGMIRWVEDETLAPAELSAVHMVLATKS